MRSDEANAILAHAQKVANTLDVLQTTVLSLAELLVQIERRVTTLENISTIRRVK